MAGFLFVSLGAAAAEVSVECLSPPREVAPRSVTTLAFRITNLGDTLDTYDLSLDLPPAFSVLVAPDSVELAPEEADVFLVSLFASALAAAGEFSVTLNAQSRTVPGDTAAAVAWVSVLPKAAVELRFPADGQGWPGTQVTYTLWVVNRGNDHDSFRLEVRTSWQFELSPELVHLVPGASAEVTLTLTIPHGAKPGDSVICRVTARSATDPDVSDSGGIRTVVLPPPPEDVPVTLFPIVPTTVAWTGKLVDAGFSSDLSLTMGGTIAPGRYLALSGTLGLQRETISLKRGWIEYREGGWSVRFGSLSFGTPVGDVSGLGVRFAYRAPHWPVRVTLCQYEAQAYGHLRWGWNNFVFDVYSRSEDGFPILATLRSAVGTLRLDLRDSASISFSTPGSPAVSGSLSWGPRTTLSVAGISRPLSSRFSYTLSESHTRMLGGVGFTMSLTEALSLRLSGEVVGRRGADPSSPLDTMDTKLRCGVSDAGRALTWALTARLDTSLDRLTAVSTLTVSLEGKLTARLAPSWTLSLESKVSQGGTGTVRSSFGLPFAAPFPDGLTNVTKRMVVGFGIAAPLPGSLRFELSGEVDGKRKDDPSSPLDTVDTELRLTISSRGAPLSWSLTTEFDAFRDRLLGVGGSTVASSLEGKLTIALAPSSTLVLESKLSQRDMGALTTSFGLSLAFPLRGADMTFKASTKPGQLQLAVEARFPSPLLLFETMGRIEGVVFDPEEKGLEGILLQIGKEQAVSGPEGVFRFYPMPPGTYNLRLLTPGGAYCARPRMPLQIHLSAGEVHRVEIALTPAATLSGRVIVYRAPPGLANFENADTAQWVADRPLARARVILTNGAETFAALTTPTGEFFFPELCPGTWEVRVQLPDLVPPHHVEQEVYTVELSPGEHHEMEIRVLPTPRIIRPLE